MKKQGLILILLVVPALILAQETDTIVKLPVVEIIDSALHKAVPIIIMPKEVFELNPVADIGEILKHEPNAGGIRKGGYAVDPIVRGYRYSQIKIFLDEGTHIEGGCPNRMDPVMSHLEPEQIEQIEIVKGPYLMEFGSSPAASIRIATHNGAREFTIGSKLNLITGYETNRNAWRQNISYRKSNGVYFYSLGGGLKKSDDYKDGNGNQWNSSFNKYYLYADAGIKNTHGSTFLISWKGSFARDVLFPALPMDEIMDNTHIFSCYYTKINPSKPSKSFSFSGYHTSVYHLMDNSFRPQHNKVVPPLSGIMQSEAWVYTRSYGLRSMFADKYHGVDFQSGIDMHMVSKNGTREMKMIMQMDGNEYTNIKYTNLWNHSVILSGGVFGKMSYESNKYSYNTILRIDFNHSHSNDTLDLFNNANRIFNFNAVDRIMPALSTAIYYHRNQDVSAGLALAYTMRAADMQERYIKFLATGYDRFDYIGNPQLKPEKNLQADLILKYSKEYGLLSVNFFVSRISDYITGILLPPSVVRPQSLGAPGVKQFNNIDKAIFTGFEVSFSCNPTPFSQLIVSGGHTVAWFPEIEKIIIENAQAVGVVTLKNDPVGEIPAMEAELNYKYDIKKVKLKPSVIIRASAPQKRISESYGEKSTPGYVVTDFSVFWEPSNHITFSGGIKNLLNTYYYDHLNRRLLNTNTQLYEPGRSFYLLVKLSI